MPCTFSAIFGQTYWVQIMHRKSLGSGTKYQTAKLLLKRSPSAALASTRVLRTACRSRAILYQSSRVFKQLNNLLAGKNGRCLPVPACMSSWKCTSRNSPATLLVSTVAQRAENLRLSVWRFVESRSTTICMRAGFYNISVSKFNVTCCLRRLFEFESRNEWSAPSFRKVKNDRLPGRIW